VPAKPALQTEDIAWAMIDLFDEHIEGALADVEVRRNAEGRLLLSLPVFVAMDMGFDELAFTLPVSGYPRLSVIGAPLSPARGKQSDQGNFAEATHEALIEWLVMEPARMGAALPVIKHEAVVRGWRYGEALLQVLRDVGTFAGFTPMTIAPQVDEGQPYAARLNRNNASEVSGYVAGGTIRLQLQGFYVAR